MGSGVVGFSGNMYIARDESSLTQALPLMNIIFGRLVGDFTQYFIPGTGMTKEKFLGAVARNTQGS
jgi:hypothetical protein